MTAQKLHSLDYPSHRRCCSYFGFKTASIVQILSDKLSNRQRYFCIACANAKGYPPSKDLIERLDELQQVHSRSATQPPQRRNQAIAKGRLK